MSGTEGGPGREAAPRRGGRMFMSFADVGLFRRSARTDALLRRLTAAGGARAASEAVYRAEADPWGSADRRYRYQSRKYNGIMGQVPAGRRFAAALDIGSGLGLLCARLAERCDTVLGIDLAQAALDRAAVLTALLPQISYRQGDASALPHDLDGRFDLVAIADTLYYLPLPITDAHLAAIALRVAGLLAPGGLVLLANHYFFAADPESRLSRRIHRAFAEGPGLMRVSGVRRCFYLVDVLAARRALRCVAGAMFAAAFAMDESMNDELIAKYDFLKKLRARTIDTADAGETYRLFVDYCDTLMRGKVTAYVVDHYLRYCATLQCLAGFDLPYATMRICESGGASVLAQFFASLGAKVAETSSDLRYSMDQTTASFDMTLSLEVIEHIKDQDAKKMVDIALFNESGVRTYAREMERVTRPGGYIVLTTPNPNSLRALMRLVGYEAPSVFRPHVREYSRTELVGFFPNCTLETYRTNSCFTYFELETSGALDLFDKNGWSRQDRGDDHFLLLRRH